MNSAVLPSFFVSHGAPTLALADNKFTRAWSAWGRDWPRPASILVVSAHWDTSRPAVSTVESPATLPDFHGFARELYDIRYPARGAPDLARRVQGLLTAAGFTTDVDAARGLDHGAWVPLRWMFPLADIPVTQLSIQSRLGVGHHFNIGRALAPLRSEGVLVMGSGGIVHNLGEIDWRGTGEVMDWARDFNDWIAERLKAGEIDALLDYRRRAPQPARAHPSEDHFDPFFVALGAGQLPAEPLSLGFDLGSLGMDSYRFS